MLPLVHDEKIDILKLIIATFFMATSLSLRDALRDTFKLISPIDSKLVSAWISVFFLLFVSIIFALKTQRDEKGRQIK